MNILKHKDLDADMTYRVVNNDTGFAIARTCMFTYAEAFKRYLNNVSYAEKYSVVNLGAVVRAPLPRICNKWPIDAAIEAYHRKRFEALISADGFNVARDSDGEYISHTTGVFWSTWRSGVAVEQQRNRMQGASYDTRNQRSPEPSGRDSPVLN